MKVAWDLYNAENFQLYLEAQCIANGMQYFGNANADDHMAVPSVVIELSKAFIEQSPPARDSGLGKRKAQAGPAHAHKMQDA